MKTRINRFKKLALALIVLPLLGVMLINSTSVATRAKQSTALVAASAERPLADDAIDVATLYKESKCLMCHGPKAAKFFDATLADDALLEIVMTGKKAETPPNMPAYAPKGITVEQAKALVAYMKSIK
ncbi:MAG: Cytochrome oxidase, cbb3-type, subunit [Acidobacteriota bacterium]|jgi:mono/diheme cytochrome c family protein|nr:Cytochrome oxidase, cbb3-type, subunit [Acidobacteriota bacterium]